MKIATGAAFLIATAIAVSSPASAMAAEAADKQIATYGALGRPLHTDEVADVEISTRSCLFLETEHVTAATINALGNILLNSNGNPRFQKACLKVAYDRIGIDIDAAGYAELEDAISLSQRKPQTFGSFGVLKRGTIQYAGDNFVDTPRSRAGLPPQSERMEHLNRALTTGAWPLIWQHPLALAPARYPTNPWLRTTLMDMVRKDQGVRSDEWHPAHPGQSQDDAMREVDAQNLPLIEAIVAKHGYPSADEVGRNGVAAMFFIVQHAAKNPNLMKHVLMLAGPLHDKGDLPPVYYALLMDRVRILNHEEQVYGTQAGQDRNGPFVYPIAALDQVNQRRMAMSMAPLNLDQLPPLRWPVVVPQQE